MMGPSGMEIPQAIEVENLDAAVVDL
jgi:hypothetical protein